MNLKIATLRCPSCGASVLPEAKACAHCSVSLHPVRCPWCFGWTFTESKDCAHCGSLAEPAAVPASCPTCRAPMTARALAGAVLSGCPGCGGVWADADSFRRLCAERETQASYLGEGSALPAPKMENPRLSPIVYRPCAICSQLMNRFNFADCSGVILDVCKPHGVWFDPDELRRIVAFIQGGGMDVARAKERAKLEVERKRLERATADAKAAQSSGEFDGFSVQFRTATSVYSARDLLRFIVDK
ncbi:MAG: zf-TFIIB domain-containing protein [Elusimicrobia bacterium]|nr:zf-TFIIB domain-containing protein [Elusimicrobiota bacterium]